MVAAGSRLLLPCLLRPHLVELELELELAEVALELLLLRRKLIGEW